MFSEVTINGFLEVLTTVLNQEMHGNNDDQIRVNVALFAALPGVVRRLSDEYPDINIALEMWRVCEMYLGYVQRLFPNIDHPLPIDYIVHYHYEETRIGNFILPLTTDPSCSDTELCQVLSIPCPDWQIQDPQPYLDILDIKFNNGWLQLAYMPLDSEPSVAEIEMKQEVDEKDEIRDETPIVEDGEDSVWKLKTEQIEETVQRATCLEEVETPDSFDSEQMAIDLIKNEKNEDTPIQENPPISEKNVLESVMDITEEQEFKVDEDISLNEVEVTATEEPSPEIISTILEIGETESSDSDSYKEDNNAKPSRENNMPETSKPEDQPKPKKAAKRKRSPSSTRTLSSTSTEKQSLPSSRKRSLSFETTRHINQDSASSQSVSVDTDDPTPTFHSGLDLPQIKNILDSLADNPEGMEKFLSSIPETSVFATCEQVLIATVQLANKQHDHETIYHIVDTFHFSLINHEVMRNAWYEANYREQEELTGKPMEAVARYRFRNKHLAPRTIWDGQLRKYKFPAMTRKHLASTFTSNPYPDAKAKSELCNALLLTQTQVKNFFKNKRQRDKKKTRKKPR